MTWMEWYGTASEAEVAAVLKEGPIRQWSVSSVDGHHRGQFLDPLRLAPVRQIVQ